MALLKTAAFKLAQKTVINTTIGNKNVSNLNQRKANTIARLSKLNVITDFIKDLLDQIKKQAISGKYVLITQEPIPNKILLQVRRYLDRKKYGLLIYGYRNHYKLIVYWGPNRQFLKLTGGNKMLKKEDRNSLGTFKNKSAMIDTTILPDYNALSIVYQDLNINDWVNRFNNAVVPDSLLDEDMKKHWATSNPIRYIVIK